MYRKIRSCTGKILTKSKLKYCVVRHRYGKPESQLQAVLIHLRNPGVVKWRCNKIELAHQGQGVADGVFNTGQKGHHIAHMNISTLGFRVRQQKNPRIQIQGKR